MSRSDGLGRLSRPSGAFAMLALDQRESLRTMLLPRHADGVPVDALPTFKVAAARALTPHASAVLLDVESGLRPVEDAGARAAGCGLLVAADSLTQEPGGVVEDTDTDEAVLADDAVGALADGYKLLVIWRADGDRAARERTVTAFVEGCRRRGRPGIVEGIVRASGTPDPDEHVRLVIEAGRELAGYGADLYKAEVPTLGRADDAAVTEGASRLTEALPCPWVVLSNGTAGDRFASAALAACRGGASGFLAGRAIWLDAIAADDMDEHLRTVAAARLRDLAVAVDDVARPWWEHPAA
jgi:sulfofructosephosphate aldolase